MSRKAEVFKYSPNIVLEYNINKTKLINIIEKKLISHKNFTAVGYSPITEEFWAKTIKNNEFVLYFTMTIEHINENSSKIIIKPFVGDVQKVIILFSPCLI